MARQGLLSRIQHAWSYYLPAIAKPFVAWFLGTSETSAMWDFRTALMVSIARAIFNDPTPVSMLDFQMASIVDPIATDSTRVDQDTMIAPDNNNLIDVVTKAIAALSEPNTSTPSVVDLAPVKGEWLGYQLSADTNPVPAHNDTVIVFLHGGQFHLRNAASRWPLVHELQRRSGGIAFSMSYRLSPQHTFPAALLDLLVVYLSLLYPTKISRHTAFPATSICLCGDSSGANIVLAFLQLIHELEKQGQGRCSIATVHWNGQDVPIPYPRVVAGHSGYLDLTRSLPSESINLGFDIIPSARMPPVEPSRYLQDAIWPPNTPRHHVYAPNTLLTHPLVSPVTARDWKGCPTRVWLSIGQECLADGNILLAKKMAEQGLDVALEMYQGMPHDFLVLLPSSATGQECLDRWAAACAAQKTQAQPVSKWPGSAARSFVRSAKGEWQEIDLLQMPPHRTRKELIQGMEATIARWGHPWSRIKDRAI